MGKTTPLHSVKFRGGWSNKPITRLRQSYDIRLGHFLGHKLRLHAPLCTTHNTNLKVEIITATLQHKLNRSLYLVLQLCAIKWTTIVLQNPRIKNIIFTIQHHILTTNCSTINPAGRWHLKRHGKKDIGLNQAPKSGIRGSRHVDLIFTLRAHYHASFLHLSRASAYCAQIPNTIIQLINAKTQMNIQIHTYRRKRRAQNQ